MAQYGGKGSFGANALSYADALGGKAMSMMKQGAIAGTNALKYRNPVYQGYQNAVSSLGAKNGLLGEKPNANSEGVTASDNLSGLADKNMFVKGTTASQKLADGIGTAARGVANTAQGVSQTANDFFTPPSENQDANDLNLSKKPANGASTATANANSSMSGETQSGTSRMPQSSPQANNSVSAPASQNSTNSTNRTPRSTPNMILHNLMNAENSQSSQFEGRRPYEPRGVEQTTSSSSSSSQNMTGLSSATNVNNTPSSSSAMSQGMTNLQSAPNASLNNGLSSEGMGQSSSLAQAHTATSSAVSQNMSGLNSATSASTGSSSVSEMRQSANTSQNMTNLQSAVTTNTGSSSTVGAMGQNTSSAPVNSANATQRNNRNGE